LWAGSVPAGKRNPLLVVAAFARYQAFTTLAFAGEHGIQCAAVYGL
jgi:hypothetical protein